MDNKIQSIYINMDDSGVLINNRDDNKVFVYGGIFFLSLREQEDFVRQYKLQVNRIKRKYCKDFKNDTLLSDDFCNAHNQNNCKYKCPELKSSLLEAKHRRWLLNLIKKYDTSVAIVENNKLDEHIFDNVASKGRFKDYTIKRLVKEILKDLIKKKSINPNIETHIFLNLDEQPTLNNGYYDLETSIKEELKYGIYNYDYTTKFNPILKNVKIKVKFRNSYHHFPVQAADLIVGEVRRAYIEYITNDNFEQYRGRTNFVNTIVNLP